MEATVIAVGPGRVTSAGSLVPVSVSAGDKVLVAKRSGHYVEVGGEKILIVDESALLCVIEVLPNPFDLIQTALDPAHLQLDPVAGHDVRDLHG